jgi:hypothetical protein
LSVVVAIIISFIIDIPLLILLIVSILSTIVPIAHCVYVMVANLRAVADATGLLGSPDGFRDVCMASVGGPSVGVRMLLRCPNNNRLGTVAVSTMPFHASMRRRWQQRALSTALFQ